MTRAERKLNWQSIVGGQVTSGMSAAAYCRDRRINLHLFYSWRRRFHEAGCGEPGGFIELVSRREDAGVRIHVGRPTICIEVSRGFDPATLCAVIDALAQHRCLA